MGTEVDMNEYMLLMKGDDSASASPEEMQTRMRDYMGWMQRMMSEDRLVAGQPLQNAGVHIAAGGASVATDGPFLEPKEVIGGYVILKAGDLDEAVALAKDCPLLAHCEIYVRPVLAVAPG